MGRSTSFTGSDGAAWSLSDGSSWTTVKQFTSEQAFSGYPKSDIRSNKGSFYIKNNTRPQFSSSAGANTGSTTDATSYSFTCPAMTTSQTLYFAISHSTTSGTDPTAVSTITHASGGGTFTLIATQTVGNGGSGTGRYRHTLYSYVPAASVNAGNITCTFGVTQRGFHVKSFLVSGHGGYRNLLNASSGTGGAAVASPRSGSVTITKTGTSVVLAFGFIDKGANGITWSSPVTLDSSNLTSTPGHNSSSGYISAPTTSPTTIEMSWSGGTSNFWSIYAIEVYDADEATFSAATADGQYLLEAGTAAGVYTEVKALLPHSVSTTNDTSVHRYGLFVRRIANNNSYIYVRATTYFKSPDYYTDIEMNEVVNGVVTTRVGGGAYLAGGALSPSSLNVGVRCVLVDGAEVWQAKAWTVGTSEPAYGGVDSSTTLFSSYTPSAGNTFIGVSGTAGIWYGYSVTADTAEVTADYDDFSLAVYQYTSITLSGTGTIAATAAFKRSTTTTLDGAGTIAATTISKRSTTTTLDGAGSLSASASVVRPTTTTLAGTGTLEASASATTPATVHTTTTTLSGAGTMTASAVITRPATTTLSGTGTVTDVVTSTRPVTTSLSGEGTATATTASTRVVTTTLSGSGSVAADISVTRAATADLTGAGSVTTSITPTRAASTTLDGAGTIDASATKTTATTITLTGTGTLTAATNGIVPAAATLSGVGGLSVTPSRAVTAEATVTGTGTLSATAAITIATSASLTGTGILSGTGTLLRFIVGATATETDDATTGSLFRRIDGTTVTEADAGGHGTVRREITGSGASETDTEAAGGFLRLVVGLVALEVISPTGGTVTRQVSGKQATSTETGRAGTPARTIDGQTAAETYLFATGAVLRHLQGSQGYESVLGTGGTTQRLLSGSVASESNVAIAGSKQIIYLTRWRLGHIPIK